MVKKFKIGNIDLSSTVPKLLTHVGVTYDVGTPEEELKKAMIAIDCGADIIADVSLGKKCKEIVKLLVKNIDVPVTSLPGYILATQNGGNELSSTISKQEILDVTEEMLSIGINGFTIHSAFKRKHLELLNSTSRLFPFSSRMGNYIRKYMLISGNENPFYECFPEIVILAKKYNATISIGTALRSPSIINDGGFDSLFKSEIDEMSELVDLCLINDVNVMVEGVGHIKIDRISEWYNYSKCKLQNVPLRVLPMITDRGMGHDNVTGAIAVAFMAQMGVEVICTMTRAEHLGHPTLEDIRESVIHSFIALSSINIDNEKEQNVATARASNGCHNLEVMKNVIDREGAIAEYKKRNHYGKETAEDYSNCSMCEKSCPLRKPN